MAVKKYEVEGTVYNVSEKGSEEFFKDFEGKEIVSLEDDKDPDPDPKKKKTGDFPKSSAAGAGVLRVTEQAPFPKEQQALMSQELSIPEDTGLPSVDISLDSLDLANEDFTLEQFKLMTPKEKNALSYSEKQRLSREKNNENNIDFIDFSSDNFEKLEDKEKIRLQELAGKQITEQYSSEGIVDFEISENQIKEKAKELLKENKNPSLITSYGAQIARGFNSFAKGTVDFLDMTKFSLMEAGLEVFDDEYKSTPENKQAIMRAVKANIGSPILTPSSLNFDTFSEKLDPYIRQYENESIVDDIAEGNYLLAGERAIGASLESLPSVVAAGLGLGGFIVLGTSSAGGKFDEEFEKDPSINTGILVANALITGGIEATLEIATRGVLKRAGILSNSGNKKAALDLIRGGSEGLVKNLGINTISEAGSEALTKTSTLLLDAAMLPGRDFNLGRDWKLIAEDAIVGSVFGISGTGAGAIKNRNVNAVQAAEYILMPDQVKKVVEESGENISKLYKNKANAGPEGVDLINEAIELETAKILNIKKQNSRALNDMTPNEVKAYANNKSKINELKFTINKSGQKDVVKKLAEDKLKTLQEVNKTLFKESSGRRVERNIQSVEKMANEVEGLTFKPLKNSEAVSEFIKENNIDVDNKKASEQQGFIYQNPETGAQTIIINKDVAKKQKAVNIAGHEFLHAVLFNTVKGSPETQIALGESLNTFINNIDPSKIKNSDFANRLKQYKDSSKATQGEEVLTLFSDALTSGDIKFNENVFTKVGDIIRRTLQSLGVKVRFNEGRDVYNFIKDYNKSVVKGRLTKTQAKATTEGVEGELVMPKVKTEPGIKESKSSTDLETELDNLDASDYDDPGEFDAIVQNLEFKIKAAKKKEAAKPKEKDKTKTKTDSKKNKKQLGDQLKEMVPLGTTQKKYQEQIAMKVINKLDGGMLNPLIKKIAAGYGIVADNVYGKSWDDFFQEVISVQFKKNIMRFNPESNDDLGGYIIGSQYGINNRIKEALEKFKKAGEGGFKEDISEAKDVTSREELSTQEAEKSKYVPLTKSNIVPSFTIKAITEKLTIIVSKLKSKITDAAGKNNSSPPLIREMKNEIGKVVGDAGAIPKLVIARLGNLKDGSYKSNLIKHKKAIIENMTTTFLMGKDNGKVVKGGIPIAIEKSVGGAFRLNKDGSREKITVNVGGKNVVQDVFDPKFIPYPEWIGQEIDREKTLVRGATAGNEIVRRVSADKVSDDAFVGLFIDEKGKLIRGKREAIGKAIGEEIAFEIFSKEIQNENSEISKAFDTNQEALGEVLADNFVNVLLKDLDRGTVKFSKTYITGFDALDNKVRNLTKYISVNNINPISIITEGNEVTKDIIEDLKKSYLEFKQKTNNDELFEGKNLTDRQKNQLKKWKKSSGLSFPNYINNVVDYNFNYVESILGVQHKSSNLKAPGAKQAGKKTISNYYSHLVDSGIPNPQEVFLRTLRGWSVSGLKISIFGNNKSLQEFITKNKVLKNAFAGYTLEKSEKFDGLTIKTASGKKAVNPILIQEVKEDLSKTVNSGTNKVDLDGRKKLADQSFEDLKRFSEFLKNGNAGSNLGKAVILNTMSSSMRSILKTVSEVKGVMAVDGLPAFNKEGKSNYTLEHGTPVKQLRDSIAYFISDENLSYKNSVGKVVENSYTYVVPTEVSKAIDVNYRDFFPGQDWVDMKEPFKARFNAEATQELLKAKGYDQTFEDITQLDNKTVIVPKQTKFSKNNLTESSQVNLNKIGLESDSNHGSLLRIQFSKSARKKYENVLRNKRPELKDIPAQVDELFKWADGLEVADNKKSKYKKLALYYTANGYTIFPEDGYKIEEAIRLSEANKVDPYAYKNPDELINKFTKEEKTKKINPDTVKEFSNKRSLPEGVTIYDVNDSKAGQRAVRSVVDSNWGKEANPWCLIARSPKGEDYIANQQAYSIDEFNDIMATESALGNRVEIEDNYTEDNGTEVWELVVYGPSDGDGMSNAWEMWKNYNEGGYGYEIAFQNGKLLSFRDGGNKIFDDDGSEYYDTGEVELNWWDRFDKPTDTLQINLGKKNGLTTRGEIYFNEAQPQGEVELVGYGEGDFMSRKDTYKLYDENKELIEAKVYKDSKLSLAVENTPTKMNDGGRAINSKKSKYIDGELISSVTTVKDLKTGKIVTTTTLSHEKLNENSYIETFKVVGKNGKSPTAPKVTEKTIGLIEKRELGPNKSTEYYAEKITDGVSEVVIDRMFELNDIKESLKSNIKFSKSSKKSITAQSAISIATGLDYNNNIKRLDITEKDIKKLSDKEIANFIINKVAEGYNDFYFADDNIKNASAVKDVLNNFDIKGSVQQAKVKFSKTLNTKFNEMLERKTGIPFSEEIEKMAGRQRGKGKGRFKIFISPSAEDFRGLTQYVFAGKGKQGEADQKFFEEALMDPYFKGVAAIEAANAEMKTELKALYKKFKGIKKKLKNNTENKNFTNDQAVRVYLWTKAGYKIPGISEQEQKTLNNTVNNDATLLRFAESLLLATKRKKWGKPGEYWDSQTLLNDIQTLTEKINRKDYIKEFIQNSELIFSEKNLNKIEASFGPSTRSAIEDSLYAMKTGSNRTVGQNQIDNKWMNWLNSSIGSIMFFNRKSALLQTLSTMNFINWHDNNPAKAALAFANQPQFWKDFVFLFNSPKLKERRGGLKSDIQSAEIANAARGSKNKASAILSYLLKIGFTPTQIADSFAISSGGATFYRNRINTYLKEQAVDKELTKKNRKITYANKYTKKQAEEKAFLDFSKISDVSQQSGDPALVSQQQRSIAGRFILAFQNYPMQSARIQKKAAQDLLNRRGDPKEHLSKILYYGAIQSVLFNTISNGLFTLFPGFDNEDEEEKIKKNSEKRIAKALKGMIDSAVKGTGIYGAVATTIKNTYKMYVKQEERGSFKADHTYTLLEGLNLSPQIGSKAADFYSAIQTKRFNEKVIEKHPWSITIDGKFNPSPNYDIAGSLSSAILNLPLDRVLVEARGVAEMLDKRNTQMQRLFLALGFRAWDVNATNEEFKLIKDTDSNTKKSTKSGGLKLKNIKIKPIKIK